MATEILTYEDEWKERANKNISLAKPIWVNSEQSRFKVYREIGQIIIKSGYTKGQWHSKERAYFIEEMKMSRPTFTRMVQLGEMNNDKFVHVMNQFTSLYEWANQSKSTSTEEKDSEIIYIDARYFSSQEELNNIIKGLNIEQIGLYFKLKVAISDKEELNRRFINVKLEKF